MGVVVFFFSMMSGFWVFKAKGKVIKVEQSILLYEEHDFLGGNEGVLSRAMISFNGY